MKILLISITLFFNVDLMQKKLAIFDVHGTLVFALPAWDKAYSKTVFELFRVNGSIYDAFFFAAPTIQEVSKAIAKSKGVSEKELKEKEHLILKTFEKHAINALHELPPKILLGVKELLKLLHENNFVIALYTGDSFNNSKLILKQTFLKQFFNEKLFACASDSGELSRRKTLEEAIKKAEKKFGKFEKKNIFVFDDSTKGLNAGKELEIKTVAVNTVPEKFEKLEKCNPNYLFKDFSSPEKVFKTIFQENL